jgi:large subunit ribosomal protein L21
MEGYRMYAVIQTGGKQYRVEPGMDLRVEKLQAGVGENVVFDRVLLASDGEQVQIGKPYVENAKVTGRITRQGKHRKVVVFKFRRRKDYRKKTGHRQGFTQVRIEGIKVGG